MLTLFTIAILGYLVGSFPTSIIVTRFVADKDIRKHGSGNAGATNVFRIVGWKAGLFTVLVDIGKGLLATILIAQLRIGIIPQIPPSLFKIIGGLFAIIGHSFPIFAKFKGGKGVATGAGMVFGLLPMIFLICVGVFILALISTGIVSLGSMLAAITLPVSYFLMYGLQDLPLLIFCLVIPTFIISAHHENIGRLFRGEEKSFENLKLF